MFEIESKLRITSVIPLIIKSKLHGDIRVSKEDIRDFVNDDDTADDEVGTFNVPDSLKMCYKVNDDDISSITDNEWPPLVYVAGYSAYSVLKKIKCEYCKTFLSSLESNEESSNIDFSLISATSRGGLCYPGEEVVKIASYAYIIVKKLFSYKEDEFLKQNKQREILKTLIFNAITELDDIFLGHNGICHSEEHLLKLLVKPMTNIFLKNYVKKRNDSVSTKTMPELKRFKSQKK